jgi:hypothetical protein
MQYHIFHLRDERGEFYDYEATDMRVALAVHQELRGTEPLSVSRLDPPMPPGVLVPVEAGTHTQVTLPNGTIHKLAKPVTIAGSGGSIFIPLEYS